MAYKNYKNNNYGKSGSYRNRRVSGSKYNTPNLGSQINKMEMMSSAMDAIGCPVDDSVKDSINQMKEMNKDLQQFRSQMKQLEMMADIIKLMRFF